MTSKVQPTNSRTPPSTIRSTSKSTTWAKWPTLTTTGRTSWIEALSRESHPCRINWIALKYRTRRRLNWRRCSGTPRPKPCTKASASKSTRAYKKPVGTWKPLRMLTSTTKWSRAASAMTRSLDRNLTIKLSKIRPAISPRLKSIKVDRTPASAPTSKNRSIIQTGIRTHSQNWAWQQLTQIIKVWQQ